MKKAEILATKKELQLKGKSNKDYCKTHFCIGYNNSLDNPSNKSEIKEVATDWRVDWFDKDRNGISDVIEQGHIGIPVKLFVYAGTKGGNIDINKTLANAEAEGHIIIINNPNKIEKKEVK